MPNGYSSKKQSVAFAKTSVKPNEIQERLTETNAIQQFLLENIDNIIVG
jgi:hypothetical protein